MIHAHNHKLGQNSYCPKLQVTVTVNKLNNQVWVKLHCVHTHVWNKYIIIQNNNVTKIQVLQSYTFTYYILYYP